MTVSNKTMERIMRQYSNLSPYDGFRIGGIGKVLNQIGLNQRKHQIIYKVSSGEFAIPMEFTGKLMFDIHPRIAYNLADQDFSRVLTLHQDFKRKDLMKEGNRPYSITYRIAYASSNTHHSDLSLRKEYIEIPRIFKEFAKIMAPDPIRIPRIGGVDIVIKDHPVLDRTISSRTEFSSRMSFSEDRTMGYKGKEKDLLKALTPQEIRIKWRESKKFTTFSTPQGQYIWNVLPMGLANAPQEHIVEKIRNFPDILKDKKHLQSFLGVVNFAGIFIKDLAKYRKDFRPLLKETESAKWKWEEIHTQMVRELKQVCNNLQKLAIPQDKDELVVYTDANDYRWAAVLMKKTTTGEEPCRYTGGLFIEQQAQVWHINERVLCGWKAFKKWCLFLLVKEFILKVDNTNVKAFLKNKLESKIEKERIIRWQAECQYYCCNIVVIKSHKNVLVDFLIRDGGI
ncbi:UNVERIFIED_CONTAM: movement protein [Sesamum angustifolium]|uniref:Movement protein n=1 Tax=Sesamum angustifolium TaxID=2727405 RepID=A0AAW2M506_9LAMI